MLVVVNCFGMFVYLDVRNTYPDSKVHRANMGPIWGRHDPCGPHIGPMDFIISVYTCANQGLCNSFMHRAAKQLSTIKGKTIK